MQVTRAKSTQHTQKRFLRETTLEKTVLMHVLTVFDTRSLFEKETITARC